MKRKKNKSFIRDENIALQRNKIEERYERVQLLKMRNITNANHFELCLSNDKKYI